MMHCHSVANIMCIIYQFTAEFKLTFDISYFMKPLVLVKEDKFWMHDFFLL